MIAVEPTQRVLPRIEPFVGYSLGLHAAAGFLLAGLLKNGGAVAQQVYTIDFVGPSATVASAAAPAAASAAPAQLAAPKPAPQTEFDEFGRRQRHGALPRPSLLRGWREDAKETPKKEAKAQPAASAPAGSASAGGGGPAGEAGISTDMPNFPYPWYITQVRSALWNQWSERMPKQRGECTAVFSIRSNGEIVDLRTEESSGDSAFDLTALSAVQDSGPFPPLPRGFAEPFLKIHVTLKTQ